MKQLSGVSYGFAALLALAAAGCGADAGSGAEPGDNAEAVGKAEAALSPGVTEVTLDATQDTTVLLSKPNQNFGTLPALDVNRALVQVSSSSLTAALGPQDLLLSAKLKLTLTRNSLRKLPRQVGAFRLTRAWTETGATWNCAADDNTTNHRADCPSKWSMGVLPPNPWASPATSVITVPAATTGVVTFDVTADVQQFTRGALVNNGWMLRGSTPGEFAEFAARESSTPPQLVLSVRRCSPSLCDDGNTCTTDSCDASASCTHTPAANGTSCNDNDACTQTDVCQAGSCTGQSPVVCTALDSCHQIGSCDSLSGACSQPLAPVGTSCADGEVCDAGGSCVGIPQIVVNEVESNGGVPGDWVELYNAGTGTADVSGWKFLDNDNGHVAYVIPAGTRVEPGAYLVLDEANFGFGLGAADSTRLFDAAGTLVDTYSWTAHAATSYGRCPNGTGAFKTTTTVTKGTANDCSVAVKINEVESSGGVPGDWVELYNAGPTAADVSGFKFLDNDDAHTPYVIPAGTVIPVGGYYLLEEAAFGFGLGAADSARLFDSLGALTDSYSWTAHAAGTYGRCPNGTGAFGTTATTSKGVANECGSTPPPPPPAPAWPGSSTVTTADELNVFGTNLSGLNYEPAADGSPSLLWAVRNGPSTLYRLVYNGTVWTPDTNDGWSAGKTLRYTDGTGGPDSEGVTRAEYSSPFVYVATERNNDVSAVSRLSVLRFDAGQAGSELVAGLDWDLTADLPTVGSNLGLEAITYVPDTFLVAHSFFDEAAGHTYNPLEYADHGTGLFLVGIEATGVIYAYALNQVTGAFVRIAAIASGNTGVMDLQFDREVGYLWAQCDDTCGNLAGILTIDANAASPTFGRFVLKKQFARPTSMPNLNNEGIAFAPESECVAGFKPFFWADDSQTDGHALRSGSVACGSFLP